MNAQNYKKWNTILGWGSFAIALITYSLTLEPTVSAWDCGEYISTSVKLEVGHPPGAPLFQMLGAFFALFTSEVTEIAKMVNFMSALASAFTILFLFWTITNLGIKLALKSGKLSEGKFIAILGGGLVGSLAYTFSDSFWFSAVEGEVYAMSSFLMALLFWLGLKWESQIKSPRGNKWLVLISFVVGLSFGVHILSLLVIPAIVLLYFFKTYKNITLKTTAIATIISVLILAFVFKLLFPYTLKFFSISELFFINSIGLPYNSGTIIAGIILIALFYFGLNYTRKKGYVTGNTLVLSVLFIMIGFSSWLMLPIRANANTTINENNPSSARELLAYYNREQYGDANVFYDKYYSYSYNQEQDALKPYRDEKPKYEKKNGKYEIVNNYENALPNWSSKHKGFIPRMVAPASDKMYKAIAGIPENSKRRPTFLENIKFMMSFQFGYMYGRYFMWNFAGRQNDTQGHLDANNGNWISGFDVIDEARLGSQKALPDDIKNNKGRNVYYFLPLILGFIGLLYQISKDKKNFFVLFLFFVFTGFAIIFYTNPKPFEPRERDYAIVGSFYIFAIWIGFGVLGLYQRLKDNIKNNYKYFSLEIIILIVISVLYFLTKYLTSLDINEIIIILISNVSSLLFVLIIINVFVILIDIFTYCVSLIFKNNNRIAFAFSIISLLAVPTLMAFQNWDDHDRSNRYTTHLNAQAYLESCDPNAIMFTIGDNDTFPLWYMQEVEGIRTDVKLVNTSLFQTDWYIDQMKKKTYKADPIPSKLKHDQYKYGTLDVAYHYPIEGFKRDSIVPLSYFMRWIESNNDITYIELENNVKEKIYPTNRIRIPVNKENALKYGIVAPKDADKIVDFIDITIDGVMGKNSILMLDILNNFDWKRPIYFTGGSNADSEYIWLKDYLQLDGLAFKLVPIKTPIKDRSMFDMGRIDTEKMYANVKKWNFRNINDGKIYLDEQTKKNAISMRNNLMRLSEVFAIEGDTIKALEVLNLSLEKMPIKQFGHYSLALGYPELYYKLGNKEKARETAEILLDIFEQHLVHYSTFENEDINLVFDDLDSNLFMFKNIVGQVEKFDDDTEYFKTLNGKFMANVNLLRHLFPTEEEPLLE